MVIFLKHLRSNAIAIQAILFSKMHWINRIFQFSYVWFGNRQTNKTHMTDDCLGTQFNVKLDIYLLIRKTCRLCFNIRNMPVRSWHSWFKNWMFHSESRKTNTPLISIFKQQQQNEEKREKDQTIVSSRNKWNWLINFIDENQLNLFPSFD